MKTMFEGHLDSPMRINLLYNYVERKYHVIANVKVAMAKKYVCNACNKACRTDGHIAVTRHVVIV